MKKNIQLSSAPGANAIDNAVLVSMKKISRHILFVCSFALLCISYSAKAQDYTITTTSTTITVNHTTGLLNFLFINTSGTNLHISVPTGYTSTYSINGGAITMFSTANAFIPLAGIMGITVNGGTGADSIEMFGASAGLPNLTINGGEGNDYVEFFGGVVTFIPNANLDIDLQNDDPNPGEDEIVIYSHPVNLSGTGSATLKASKGIRFNSGGQLNTINGNIIIEANQQPVAVTNNYWGIFMYNAKIEATGSGRVNIKARGGSINGITINESQIIGGTSDSLTVEGTGSALAFNNQDGVYMSGSTAMITSHGGPVRVTGNGNGSGASVGNTGIAVFSSASIRAGGNGTVTVNGTGGNSTGAGNWGIAITNSGMITSSGGNVYVNGQGSNVGTGSKGVGLQTSGMITAAGNGNVTVTGTGGNGGGTSNYGIDIWTASITSAGGNVNVTGNGMGSGANGFNYGVRLHQAGIISAGGNGTVTVTGTGGVTSGSNNEGVSLTDTNSTISSSGGNVIVTGYGGGTGTAGSAYGVNIASAASITSGGSGTVTVNGTGASSTGNQCSGVHIEDNNSKIGSSGGNINVTGTKGPNSINTAYDIYLEQGGTILSSGTGGNIVVAGTSNGLAPNTTGTDISTSAAKTLSFGNNSKLNISINGTTVNAQYQQLNNAGLINLSNATLTFTGSTYVPVGGEIFIILDNDGTDAITGTFAGLPEGATINNFLGSTKKAFISYIGGTGNDAVITVCNLTASISGSTSFCSGSSTTLNAGSGYSSYAWSNGATTQTISANTAGTYTVTVTNGSACTASSTKTITVNANPTPAITGSTSFCAGSSTVLNAGSFNSYTWSTGATTQTISVSTAGTFTVTVTNASGCTGSDSHTTTVNANPAPVITGSTSFCAGSSTVLNAGSFNTYAWSTGATTQTISVNAAGTFTVTVTNASGCTGTDSHTTTVNANPAPSITGSTSFCLGSSTVLNAGNFSSFSWSTGATTQTISVSIAGTFTLTVTNASGCTGSANASTTVNANPTPSISGSLSFCSGSSTTLDAGSGYTSYLWDNASTSSARIVSTAGTFTVTVTNVSGCIGSVSVTTTVNANLTPSIFGSLSFCAGSSTTLNAGSGYSSYNWSNGATTQTISANTAATFTVTVTNANGCTGSANVSTTVNANPTPSISGSLSFCAGSSTTLNAGSGYSSYNWSNGATSQTISVSTAGTFTVTVTNGNGCTGSVSVTTTVNANLTPSISGSLSFCSGSSTTLNAGSGYSSYNWS
ncbi:MAG: hypothetical protein ABI723_13960, partial [Bacteroidia bacterium]